LPNTSFGKLSPMHFYGSLKLLIFPISAMSSLSFSKSYNAFNQTGLNVVVLG